MNNQHNLPRAPSADRHRMIHPWLPAASYAALESEAVRRKLHPDVFAALLIDIVATDKLFGAILDR